MPARQGHAGSSQTAASGERRMAINDLKSWDLLRVV
jgi:hypothetical protein